MSTVPKARSIDLTSRLAERAGIESRLADAAVAAYASKHAAQLGHESLEHILDPTTIPISPELTHGHILESTIRKELPLDSKDILYVLSRIRFRVPFFSAGAIPAATNEATTYATHSWTRDAAIVALALSASGYRDEAADAMNTLAVFYAREEQRKRFLCFHFSPNPESLYRSADMQVLPHIRAHIGTDGNLVECKEPWPHNQLDAIGMWLSSTFTLANEGALNLRSLDEKLSAEINSNNRIESIFPVALKALYKMKFWNQLDRGPWEEKDLPKRSSSIGACLCAFKEARRFFLSNSDHLAVCRGKDAPSLNSMLDHGIVEARSVLASRLLRGEGAIESELEPADSSLAFLLYPFNPGLLPEEESAILRTLYSKRMGEIGFTRHDNDAYVGMDYPYTEEPHLMGIFSDISVQHYRAAEWTLFDPLLSSYFYNRFLQSKGLDFYAFMLADRHLRRALSFITKGNDQFRKAFNNCDVLVPQGIVPEAFWYDSRVGKWRPNENSPLLMAEAAYVFMFERAVKASTLHARAQKPSSLLQKLRAKASKYSHH